MLLSSLGIDIVWGAALVLDISTKDLYSSQTVIRTVHDASRDLFWRKIFQLADVLFGLDETGG